MTDVCEVEFLEGWNLAKRIQALEPPHVLQPDPPEPARFPQGRKRGETWKILQEQGLDWSEAAFVGDDLPDLACVMGCGIGIAVADACHELREAADIVTEAGGGRGAVREVVERMLQARGVWEASVRRYQSGHAS